ncbi:PapB/FocB family fimbrial expression transcriptional regulator, partial [Escherichia coli]|nr:PapB/FocB family fimbrial expression transcriptional regulator [Escherichia coli]
MTPSPYPRNNFNTELIQSCMNGEHFSLLIEISPIRSKKNIMALKEYLVDGYSKGTVAKLAMRQPFVLFKGLTFQKLCLP